MAKEKKHKARGALACLFLILALPTFASDSKQELRYIGVHVQFETNISVAEEICAKLLLQYSNSPEALGKIYLSMALNGEYQKKHEFSKIIENSQKALQFPLDNMDACRAYQNLADGLQLKMILSGHSNSPRLNEREQTVTRKQILDVYLNGLKLILSKAKTLQKQDVPGVEIFDGVNVVILTNATQTQEERDKIEALNRRNALSYQKEYQECQAQLKAHDEIVAANDLVDQYNRFKRDVIDLYLGIPFTEEITEEGEKIMPGAPVLKELVEEVKKSNAPAPPTSGTRRGNLRRPEANMDTRRNILLWQEPSCLFCCSRQARCWYSS